MPRLLCEAARIVVSLGKRPRAHRFLKKRVRHEIPADISQVIKKTQSSKHRLQSPNIHHYLFPYQVLYFPPNGRADVWLLCFMLYALKKSDQISNFQISKCQMGRGSPPTDATHIGGVGLIGVERSASRHTDVPSTRRAVLGTRPVGAGNKIIAKTGSVGIHAGQLGQGWQSTSDRFAGLTGRIGSEIDGVVRHQLIAILSAICAAVRFVAGDIGILPLLSRADIGPLDEDIGPIAQGIATDVGGATEPCAVVTALGGKRHLSGAGIDRRVPGTRHPVGIREAIEDGLAIRDEKRPAGHRENKRERDDQTIFLQPDRIHSPEPLDKRHSFLFVSTLVIIAYH